MSKRLSIFSILKGALIVVFVIGVIVLAVFPVRNQPVTLEIDAGKQRVQRSFSADELKEMQTFSIEISEEAFKEIVEIRIHRSLRSISVDKITSESIPQYIEYSNGAMIFNDSACKLLRTSSQSFYMERLLMAECLAIVVLVLWIMLNAVKEKLFQENYNHGPIYEIKKFIGELHKYWQYMVYAANADLKAEVANSYLNRLWWLLEPFFNMLVYVIVFGRVLGNSVRNYATFVFSALLMWSFFSKTINYSVKCVRNNRDIVTKIYVPKHVLLISNMILNFLKLLFSMIVLVPMLFIFHVKIGPAVIWVLAAYALMILLSFAEGMVFLHYGVYVDDLAYAVGILLQMLMFLSGVFYDVITSLQTPLNSIMICLNPVAMFIDTMRNALLYNSVTNVPQIMIWTVLSMLIGYIGLHIVYKNENGYVKVI